MELTLSRKLKFCIPGCSSYTPLECSVSLTKTFSGEMTAVEARQSLSKDLKEILAQEILEHVEQSVSVLTEDDFDDFVDKLIEDSGQNG